MSAVDNLAFATELPSETSLLTAIKAETLQMLYQTMQIFALASRDVMRLMDFRLKESHYQANYKQTRGGLCSNTTRQLTSRYMF
jgi:hypothetical protein